MKIGVVIASHNRRETLNRLIRCLLAQKIPDYLDMEYVVVADGCTDGTVQMIRQEFSFIHLIEGSGSWWWTKCMNTGFKKTLALNCDFALVINDDNEIFPDYLATLVHDYSSLPESALLGSASVTLGEKPLVCFSGNREVAHWRMKVSPLIPHLSLLDTNMRGVYQTHTLSGRGMFIPCPLLRRLELFDEKLVQYGSDDDFALRAKKAGSQVFVSWNARVFTHLHLTSTGAAHLDESFIKFLKSFLNKYSVNSIRKAARMYYRHGISWLTPLYLLIFIGGTIKARYFK